MARRGIGAPAAKRAINGSEHVEEQLRGERPGVAEEAAQLDVVWRRHRQVRQRVVDGKRAAGEDREAHERDEVARQDPGHPLDPVHAQVDRAAQERPVQEVAGQREEDVDPGVAAIDDRVQRAEVDAENVRRWKATTSRQATTRRRSSPALRSSGRRTLRPSRYASTSRCSSRSGASSGVVAVMRLRHLVARRYAAAGSLRSSSGFSPGSRVAERRQQAGQHVDEQPRRRKGRKSHGHRPAPAGSARRRSHGERRRNRTTSHDSGEIVYGEKFRDARLAELLERRAAGRRRRCRWARGSAARARAGRPRRGTPADSQSRRPSQYRAISAGKSFRFAASAIDHGWPIAMSSVIGTCAWATESAQPMGTPRMPIAIQVERLGRRGAGAAPRTVPTTTAPRQREPAYGSSASGRRSTANSGGYR